MSIVLLPCLLMIPCTYVCMYTVLEIRRKWRMDKYPSIILLDRTVSDLLVHTYVFLKKYTCAAVDVRVLTGNESVNRHSQYK